MTQHEATTALKEGGFIYQRFHRLWSNGYGLAARIVITPQLPPGCLDDTQIVLYIPYFHDNKFKGFAIQDCETTQEFHTRRM